MDDIDELMEALRSLYARLATLQAMEPMNMLLPGQPRHFLDQLDDAYAALGIVETNIDELGQALEYEHDRLQQAIKQYGGEESQEQEA